jgi:glycosyltransferase involved in cell wall biosynthesis
MAETLNGRRLLVLTERFFPESFLVNELVPAFVERGFTVTVITQAPSYPADRLYPGYRNVPLAIESFMGARVLRVRTVLGYKRSRLRKILNYASFAVLAAAALVATGRRYHAVFVFHTGPLTLAAPLFLVKGAEGRRCIWTQDVWPEAVFEYGFPSHGAIALMLKAFVRAVYRRCDAIAVTSPGFREPVARYAPEPSRVFQVPQWAPEELIHGVESARPARAPDGEVLFRFAGNLGTMQNLTRLINGFERASVERGDLRLELFGDGSERAGLEELCERRGLKRVRFLGRVPMREIMGYLRQSDFLLLPLVGRGVVGRTIPAKFQAYLSAGRPVFAVVAGALASMVGEYGIGVVADPEDELSIARGFLQCASTSIEERARMSASEATLLSSLFSKEAAVKAFVDKLSKQPENTRH